MTRMNRGWSSYPKTKRRTVKGGIKSQSKHGRFGTQWWAKRWIAALEKLDIGSRLVRGRSYARSGQVLDIAVAAGRVTAKVQGSRARPYAVEIRVAVLGKSAWHRVTERIVAQARFAAKLLAGEMPHDIEEAFSDAGSSLFPESLRELQTECSCPDWSNPCKHIAAVYYLLGEEFDRDPFLLFTLRGGEKRAIFADLDELQPAEAPVASPERLPEDAEAFWHGAGPMQAHSNPMPETSAALRKDGAR